MRPIEFRAWDKELKEMWKSENLTIAILNGKITYLSYKPNANTELTTVGRYLDSERYELMQFTGLRDKNGNKIFEGDIVRRLVFNNYSQKQLEAWRGVVEMKFGEWEVSTESLWRICYQNNAEIIGNIHEHPHLLEKSV